MYLLRILLNDLCITSLVSCVLIWLKSSYWIFRFTVFFCYALTFLIYSITMNFQKALLNNLNISFSKSFLAFFLFSLLNSMCVFNISFGSNFIALCIFLILTHASGKFVQFWFGLHARFYHLSSISFFVFSSFGSLLPLICLCISTCLSDSIFALTFFTSSANG